MVNGWPLFDRRQTFATIAGFYASVNTTNGTNFPWLQQCGGESVIAGIPHWSGLLVESHGHVLDASTNAAEISNFVSTLDHKQGLKTWSYTWTPGAGSALNVTYRMLVHKLFVNQAAVELSVTSAVDTNVTVIDVLQGDCAVRSEFVGTGHDPAFHQIWSAVKPRWIGNVTAYVYSSIVGNQWLDSGCGRRYYNTAYTGGNLSGIAQAFDVPLQAGETSIITKYVGVASSEAFTDPQATALQASRSAASMGFPALLRTNAEEWAQVMPLDSVDNYALQAQNFADGWSNKELITLQILAVTNPWHILSNTVSANAIKAAGNNTRLDIWSIAVGGLGSSTYAGWIFWDAEIWIAPGIVVTNPQAAKQMANYRKELFPQAQANINDAYQGSTNTTRFTPGGAAYPWISGKFGNCTAAGPCFDYEYHLNGDIALELYHWYVVTGDTETFKNEFFPIYDAAAYFFAELVERNNATGRYELFNATDPVGLLICGSWIEADIPQDEYANHVDNPAFTLALIKTLLVDTNELRARFGIPPNVTWTTISDNILIPTNENAGIILEYGAMNGTINVKQADVVLIDDFLDFPNPYSLSDLDYYAGKQSINGPGMTFGVYSIIANEISPSGCASYTYDLYGSLPYVRGPWFQYSEQLVDEYSNNGGTHPTFPFLTGMGGAHRVAIFGYLGLRLFIDTLNIDPNLPPQIPYIRYRTFYWQGHPISAWSNSTHTTLQRLAQPLPKANSTYHTGAIPITIGLSMNDTRFLAPNSALVIANRQAGFNATVPGNQLQCHPVLSPEDYLPGQFPSSAVDGAVSTNGSPL